jgi:hypothetical protein
MCSPNHFTYYVFLVQRVEGNGHRDSHASHRVLTRQHDVTYQTKRNLNTF